MSLRDVIRKDSEANVAEGVEKAQKELKNLEKELRRLLNAVLGAASKEFTVSGNVATHPDVLGHLKVDLHSAYSVYDFMQLSPSGEQHLVQDLGEGRWGYITSPRKIVLRCNYD